MNSLVAPRDEDIARLRVPPHSIEAEQSVLGGLLIDNSAWDRAADLVSDTDFYRLEHKLIFQAVGKLITAGKPLLLLPQHLEQMMTARRAAALGAGLVADPLEPASLNYERSLKRLLGEPAFTAAARDIAARHVNDNPAERAALVAQRCEELIRDRRPA